MKLPKSMTSIHHEIMQNHEAARRSAHTWGVFGINKNGATAKVASCTFTTEAEATKKAEYMSRINGGKQFIAKAL